MCPQQPVNNTKKPLSPGDRHNTRPNDDFLDTFQATPFFSNIFETLYDNVGHKFYRSDDSVVIERRNSLLCYSNKLNDSLPSDEESYSSAPGITMSTTPSSETIETGRGRISKKKLYSKPTPLTLDTSFSGEIPCNSPIVNGSINTPESSTSTLQDILTKAETTPLHLSTNFASSALMRRRSTSLEKRNISPSQATLESPISTASLSYSPLPIPNDTPSLATKPQTIQITNTPLVSGNRIQGSSPKAVENTDSSLSTQSPPNTDHSTKSNIHPCTICGKEFQRPSTLETHMNIHSGKRPYECPFLNCEKVFNAKSNMLRHLKMHFKLGKGKYLLPNGEISSTKPTAKQLTCFTNSESGKQ